VKFREVVLSESTIDALEKGLRRRALGYAISFPQFAAMERVVAAYRDRDAEATEFEDIEREEVRE
jgi:hypothetical protein